MIAYSTDGIVWTAATFPFDYIYFNNFIYGVAWGGDKFLVFGRAGVLVYSGSGTIDDWTLAG
jgi:hypothetical protein